MNLTIQTAEEYGQKAKAKAKSKANHQKKSNSKGAKTATSVPMLPAPESQHPKIKAWVYKMRAAAQGCIDRYLELSGLTENSFKEVSTPCIDDHLVQPEDFQTKGVLASVCSKAVLKCLYMTRIARPEFYWAAK